MNPGRAFTFASARRYVDESVTDPNDKRPKSKYGLVIAMVFFSAHDQKKSENKSTVVAYLLRTVPVSKFGKKEMVRT